jgi:hypothetical protein
MAEPSPIEYVFAKPDQVPLHLLQQIRELICKGKGVAGTKYLDDNLKNAFLIGYALCRGRVVGTVVHKHPTEVYRRKIEAATGLDLSEYLERGYTTVDPSFQDQDVADTLIKGLIARSQGRKIYVTIWMENQPPLALTYKNGMSLAATFVHPISGRRIGVFTNHPTPPRITNRVIPSRHC